MIKEKRVLRGAQRSQQLVNLDVEDDIKPRDWFTLTSQPSTVQGPHATDYDFPWAAVNTCQNELTEPGSARTLLLSKQINTLNGTYKPTGANKLQIWVLYNKAGLQQVNVYGPNGAQAPPILPSDIAQFTFENSDSIGLAVKISTDSNPDTFSRISMSQIQISVELERTI